jgi:NADPH-dependent curcumin reductase CurA
VFVSGAAGAVGSVAAQLAAVRGARVLGSAGTQEKIEWLRELGLDGVFDYRVTPTRDALRELAPDGIDVYFDNVGGETLEAAIGAMRLHGRVVACGAISLYNATEALPGPRNLFMVVTKRLRIQGYIISDHYDQYPAFLGEVGLRGGRTIRYRETVPDGIEQAPAAFVGMLEARTSGRCSSASAPSPNETVLCRVLGTASPRQAVFLTQRRARCTRCGKRVRINH